VRATLEELGETGNKVDMGMDMSWEADFSVGTDNDTSRLDVVVRLELCREELLCGGNGGGDLDEV